MRELLSREDFCIAVRSLDEVAYRFLLADRDALCELVREQKEWLDRATVFTLPDDTTIEARVSYDDKRRWCVKRRSLVLGKDCKWDYEPIPSSRTEEFKVRTRWNSFGEAFAALSRAAGMEEKP